MSGRWLFGPLLMSMACAGQANVQTQTNASSSAAASSGNAASSPKIEEPESPAVDAALTSPSEPPRVEPAPLSDTENHLGKDPYAGSIDRAGLVAIVDQGLGRFFQHLRLEPVLEKGRFLGFRVGGIDPAWGPVGLSPGDVIVRVNGRPIERPEQAMMVFESLRTAEEVAVELTRAGVPATLRYRIQ